MFNPLSSLFLLHSPFPQYVKAEKFAPISPSPFLSTFYFSSFPFSFSLVHFFLLFYLRRDRPASFVFLLFFFFLLPYISSSIARISSSSLFLVSFPSLSLLLFHLPPPIPPLPPPTRMCTRAAPRTPTHLRKTPASPTEQRGSPFPGKEGRGSQTYNLG